MNKIQTFVLMLALQAAAYSPYISALFSLESNSFINGARIPDKYGRKHGNISPQLVWKDVPPNTASFAVICKDSDAGDFAHWILYNIPTSVRDLTEGISVSRLRQLGVQIGTNSFGNPHYDGPQPPSGTHHYFFTVYALDGNLNLKDNPSYRDVIKAFQGHILGTATLIGSFPS